nr:MAG TPA: Nuclease [Caudoviricetes sp.]
MAKTPEGEIVEYIKKQLKARGCLVRKIGYEMRRGCPDLIAFVPMRPVNGIWPKEGGAGIWLPPITVFIEVKKDENTQPEEHQLREHERIRQHGGFVWVIGSKAQMDELIEELKL